MSISYSVTDVNIHGTVSIPSEVKKYEPECRRDERLLYGALTKYLEDDGRSIIEYKGHFAVVPGNDPIIPDVITWDEYRKRPPQSP